MEYKPSDVFVGVVDLFGVFMPGAIATYLLRAPLIEEAKVLGVSSFDSDATGWTAFFVGSYVLGHLVFLVGALFDYGDAPFRRLFVPWEKNARFLAAQSIRDELLGINSEAINTFQFAKAIMQLHHQGAIMAVTRLEADSKFFRSLSVVLLILLVARWHLLAGPWTFIVIALLILCIWRYGERRWKSSQLAFGYLMAHQASLSMK